MKDAPLTTDVRYRWTQGSYLSPYSTNSIVLESDGVSLFTESTGPASFGALPPEGSTVVMQIRQNAGQTYEFNPNAGKLKYLSTNTNYDEVDIDVLLPLLNTATPISGGPENYEAQFIYNTANTYLYLVWDLRSPTPIELCYDVTALDSCCGCTGGPPPPPVCNRYKSIPYDNTLQITYLDCDGDQQTIFKQCSSPICEGEEFCATEIISTNETLNDLGTC